MLWLKRALLVVIFAMLGLLVYGIVRKIVFPDMVTAPAGHSHVVTKKPSQSPPPLSPVPPKPKPDYSLPPITDGLAPVLSRIPTKQPVVFLGIDDGAYKNPAEISLMKANDVKATFFLANLFILDNPNFFKQLSH